MNNKKQRLPLQEDLNLIDELGLAKEEVLQIVSEWYANGMCKDIIQNEDGLDLEDIIYEESLKQ